MKKEMWKDIKGFEGLYQVSNFGRVKSLPKEWVCGRNGGIGKHNGMILKIQIDKETGYIRVTLTKKNIRKHISIHRLVGIHFITNPNNKPVINHINGIKLDNRIENLEWVSHAENNQHAFYIGLNRKGEEHSSSKLTEKEVLEIRSSGLSSCKLAKIYNVSSKCILNIKNNKSWKHI
jgi:hypothetical protein